MKYFLHLCLIFFNLGAHSQELSSEEILQRSIDYHDPKHAWPSFAYTLNFSESRPDGSVRKTTVVIDNSKGYFKLNRNNEEISGMILDSCFVEKGDLTCDRAAMFRNYYTYLWGLPMKLHDKGTPLSDRVEDTQYLGESCYALTVTYEKDTWTFYIRKSNFQMIAYQFIQDEATGKGEYILLAGELLINDMRIPKERSWYTLPDSSFLGTDILDDFTRI
jgi:hypothetical protein